MIKKSFNKHFRDFVEQNYPDENIGPIKQKRGMRMSSDAFNSMCYIQHEEIITCYAKKEVKRFSMLPNKKQREACSKTYMETIVDHSNNQDFKILKLEGIFVNYIKSYII